VKAFRKAARDLGCDKSEERFQKGFPHIRKAKPKSATVPEITQ
jgi:hypothetical protein